MTVSETVEVRASVRARARPPKGRWFFEHFSGDELYRKIGKWMKKVRRIDRRGDWYSEVVCDPETGEVVHRCEEPLSEHVGHGSAKRKKNA